AADRGRVVQLAREGLSRQGGQTYDAARKVGERYLGAISDAAGESLDGVVARVARKASGLKLYDQSAYYAQNFALKALAAGVGGAIGPALASIGYEAIYKSVWHEPSYAYHDGRSIGAAFLDGISANSQDATERELARVARQAASDYLFNETAFKVQAEALKRIRNGVAGQDVAATLASFGRAARMASLDNENARKVGYPILDAIVASGDARAGTLARVARQASAAYLHQDAANLAQDVGFVKVLEKPTGTLAQDLADLGTRSLNHCKYAEDQRNLGQAILRGIAKHAAEPGVALLARVADDATCPHLYHRSAAGAHYDAFHLIAKGGTVEADPLLARFGLSVLERADTVDDSRTMGHVVLAALTEHAADSVKKGVLEGALRQSADATSDQVAVGVQRFAFNWVTRAPSLPTPSPGSGQELDAAVLEQRIGLHESVRDMLEDEVTRQSQDLAEKQVQMRALADEFNPMVDVDRKLLRNFKIARAAFFVGVGATVAGVLIQPGVIAPLLHDALKIGGLVAAVGGWLSTGTIKAKRKALLDGFWPKRNAYDQLDGEAQALQAASAATRALIAPVEAAIQADRDKLGVVKISDAMEPPKGAGSIKLDRKAVIIGGVRIARAKPTVARGEDKDAPAVSAEPEE
ncbi:MAG: hypothetical protein AB1758_05945, partial [Candidatus Eremiobacterota bacterium]